MREDDGGGYGEEVVVVGKVKDGAGKGSGGRRGVEWQGTEMVTTLIHFPVVVLSLIA